MSAPPSRRGRRWDDESIRAALRLFLGGRKVWPTYDEFVERGAKGLRDAVGRHGGPARWAREMGVSGGDRRPGGVRRWTDERIRATLVEFLGDRTTWPTRREFDEAGLHAFYEALHHYGGPERWARELGVVRRFEKPAQLRRAQRRKPREPKRANWPKWNNERIAAELAVFLEGRDEWPRHTEFVNAGRKGLYQAVLAHGGARAWAKRMGVDWVERHGGYAPAWTEGRVRARLGALLADRRTWPSSAEFRAAGEGRLLAAVRRLGGVDRWAAEFGVSAAAQGEGDGSRPSRRAWTDERIAAEVSPLVERLGRWPTKGEFRRAGLGAALSAIYDHGGSAVWQRRLGVSRRPFEGPVPDRTEWTESRVEAELRVFCAGRSEWPTVREFEAAGQAALYHAASSHGGIRRWRERLGMG